MTKIEKILLAAFAVGLVLKQFQLPAAGILTSLSLFLLAVVYFPFGFISLNSIRLKNVFSREAYSGVSGMRIAGAEILGLGLSLLSVGVMFKVSFYPGAEPTIFAGLFVSLIMLILATVGHFRNQSKAYGSWILRVLVLAGLALLVLWLGPGRPAG